MDINLIGLIRAAVLNGTPLLFGTSGEILTEKSGNLNLGVEGLMFMAVPLDSAARLSTDRLQGITPSARSRLPSPCWLLLRQASSAR